MTTLDQAESEGNEVERSTERRFRRAVVVGTAVAAVIAIAGILGYVPGLRAFGSIRPDYIPMAPSTAACILIFAAALYGHDRKRWTDPAGTGMSALVLLVVVFGLLDIVGNFAGLDLTGEDRLTSGMGTLAGIPIGRMSVATSFTVVIAGVGTLLACLRAWTVRRRERLEHVASSLGVVTGLLGGTVALGYLFGTPLMYGGSTVPMALTTSIALLCTGAALVATAGPRSFPMRHVVGDSLAPRLSRIFLGLTASSLLVEGILAQRVAVSRAANSVLLTSGLIIVTCAIVAYVVARVARGFGTRLEESTRQLRESEERHRTILETAMDGFWLVDAEGRLLEVNEAYGRMSGYGMQELLAMHISDLEAVETAEDTGRHIRKIMASGEDRFESRHRRKDGSVFDVAVSIQYRAAGVGGLAVFIGDITARKRAEAVLHQQETHVRRMLESMSLIGLILDPQGRIVFCNDYFLSLTGWTRADVMARNWFDTFLPPDVRDGVRNEVFTDGLARGTMAAHFENEIVTRDGGRRVIRWSNTVLRDVTGSVDGVASIGEDVSARRQVEEALKESEFFFRESQRAARIGSYHLDLTTGLWKSSEVLDAVFGIDASYVRSISGWGDLIHPDDNAVMTQYLQGQVLGKGVRFDREYRIVRKSDGAVRWVRGLGELAYGADGAVTAMTGTIQDVTESKVADERLRTSEEKFRSLFNNAQVGMFRTRLDGSEVLDLNDHYLRILERTREEQLGRPSEFLWANPQERAEMVRRLEADGRVTDLEFDLLDGDGEVRRCITSLRLVPEEGILEGSIQDITDRRTAEDALRASEQEFRSLAEAMPQIVWATRPDGWSVYFNSRWVEYTGLTLEESYGHGWNAPFHPDEQQLAWDAWQRATQFDEPYAVECRLRRADGEYRWFLIRGEPLRGDNGEILKWFGTCTDIHDIKTAEESLRLSERRLQDITASIGDWVWEVDAHGVYTYGSAKGEALLGDVIGKTPFDFMPPAEAERVAAIFAGIVATKAPIRDLENWIVTRDGEDVCMLTNGVPILDAGGNLTGYRGVDKDITDRKRAEQEQVRLNAQLQQAQKMESVGRLAGGVAHDFNNMLGVILGNVDLALGRVDAADPLNADLEEIKGATLRSAELTRRLLAFARKQTVSPKVLDLNETVAGMLRMLQRLIGEDIDLRWTPADGLWPVKIDPSQVDQMLANLCVNARDAIAGTGELTIETGHRTFTAADCVDRPEFVPGEYVKLAVSDDGAGMDAETLSHLWEPFFTTKAMGKGTGLGLATVYGIVRQNGGFVDVHSELSHGTSFRIYLPRHVGETAPVRAQEQRPLAARGHETILVAEDEPGILALAAKLLELQGYLVLPAGSPGEALRLAREHAGEIHLLLTDVVMPQMNGRDLARSMLSLHPRMKRLFMSGYTADVIAHRGVLDDDVQFIQKPFSLDELTAKVRAVLDSA